MIQTVDAHHHLWHYAAAEYDWIDDSMPMLRRDYTLLDLEREAEAAGVNGTVAVQARQSELETRWLLELARGSELLRGVVGWVDLRSSDVGRKVEKLAREPKLVGLRHVVQAEPEGFLDGAAFDRGIGTLRGNGLVYDVLIAERQMEEATRFVDRHHEQAFVLDHVGKPRIAAGDMEPWRTNLIELARRPNVWCKVSGMVTEADWASWSEASLRPYLDAVVDAFGPSRLMTGSDWPVCLVASDYARWWNLLRAYFAPFGKEERTAIFGGCACEVYGLAGGEAVCSQ